MLAVLFAALYLYTSNTQISSLPFLPPVPEVKQLEINGAKLNVEIADTQEKRSKGLSGRESLATDSGMLFIFPKASRYSFWMKGLSFPLDFVWIKGDKVISVLQNVPPSASGQPDSSLPVYEPNIDVDKVLEVNAGVIQRLNIKVGDAIKIQ